MKPSKIQIGGQGQNLTITTSPPQTEGEGTNVQIQYGDQMEDVLISESDDDVEEPNNNDVTKPRLSASQRAGLCMALCKARFWTIVAGVQIAVWIVAIAIFSIGFGVYRYYVWMAVLAFFGIWCAIYHLVAYRLGSPPAGSPRRRRWRWVILAHALMSLLVLAASLLGALHPGFEPTFLYKDQFGHEQSINLANGLVLAVLGLMEGLLALVDLCYRHRRQTKPPQCQSISEYIDQNNIGPPRSDRPANPAVQSDASTGATPQDDGAAASASAAATAVAPAQPVQVFIINNRPQQSTDGDGDQHQGPIQGRKSQRSKRKEQRGKLNKHRGPSYETFNGPCEADEMPPPYTPSEASAPPGYQ